MSLACSQNYSLFVTWTSPSGEGLLHQQDVPRPRQEDMARFRKQITEELHEGISSMPSDLAGKSSQDMITCVETNTRKNVETFNIKELDKDSIEILQNKGEWLNSLIILKSLYHLKFVNPSLDGFYNYQSGMGENGFFVETKNKNCSNNLFTWTLCYNFKCAR